MVRPPFPHPLPPPKAEPVLSVAEWIRMRLKRPNAFTRIFSDQLYLCRHCAAQTLTGLLGFPGIEVTHFFIEEEDRIQYLHLDCDHQHDVAMCPRCQQAAHSGYDHKRRSVRHLDVFGMRTIIHPFGYALRTGFDQRRFDCEVCGKPFSEILNWIGPKRRQTREYEDHIFQQVKKPPRKHVALKEGLSESTVLDIFRKFVKTLRNWWEEFLNYFDEGITQGFVEGTNQAIRGIINRAFGFRDFANFRWLVLTELGDT